MAEPTPAQRAIGDFAPKLVELTDNVLFSDVWERPELPKRDRSLITVASLVTSGSVEQLVGHLRLAKQNGLTEAELKEAIVHLAFYAGWPKAMSAIQVAKQVFADFQTFYQTIHKKLPETRIVYLSIHLPPGRVNQAAKIDEVNSLIAATPPNRP